MDSGFRVSPRLAAPLRFKLPHSWVAGGRFRRDLVLRHESAKVGNPYLQLSFHLRGGLSAMGHIEKN